jgi:hypothetical protein
MRARVLRRLVCGPLSPFPPASPPRSGPAYPPASPPHVVVSYRGSDRRRSEPRHLTPTFTPSPPFCTPSARVVTVPPVFERSYRAKYNVSRPLSLLACRLRSRARTTSLAAATSTAPVPWLQPKGLTARLNAACVRSREPSSFCTRERPRKRQREGRPSCPRAASKRQATGERADRGSNDAKRGPRPKSAGRNRVQYTMYCPPGLVSPGACTWTRIGARGGVGMSPTRLAPSHRVATALLGHSDGPPYAGSPAPIQSNKYRFLPSFANTHSEEAVALYECVPLLVFPYMCPVS